MPNVTGSRMKARRKALGLSAEYVAEQLGLSPATIYRYENGGIDKVPGDILEPLAMVLKTTPADLMGWEKHEHYSPAPKLFYDEDGSVKYLGTFDRDENTTLITLLYYEAMEEDKATAIEKTLDMLSGIESEAAANVANLVRAYLNADQPIRDIVDTALRPYLKKGNSGEAQDKKRRAAPYPAYKHYKPLKTPKPKT